MTATDMLVIDASAAIHVLTGRRPDPRLLDRIDNADSLHAPHLIDVEALHVLRGLVRGGVVSEDRASEARRGLRRFGLFRYPHAGLVERAWQLRHNFTAYDAMYVALSEMLGCTLVTSDGRLASGSGHEADIEFYAQH
jgi:predicted nucleic acid-binding protein